MDDTTKDQEHAKPVRELEFLEPIVDMVTGFTDIADEVRDESIGIACSVTEIKVELPVEIGTHVEDDGSVTLASAPPTQQIETTVFPVLHKMRLGVVIENGSERE